MVPLGKKREDNILRLEGLDGTGEGACADYGNIPIKNEILISTICFELYFYSIYSWCYGSSERFCTIKLLFMDKEGLKHR